MDDLYKNIKKLRIMRGLSQDELAEKMGYTSRSTIAKIESGKNDIPQSKIKAFAAALGTTPAKLMGFFEQDMSVFEGADKNRIAELADSLNSRGKKKTIDYMEILSSNSDFTKSARSESSQKSVTMPVAARGSVSGNNTLTKEEYLEAENTVFDELKPKKELPKF